MFRRLPWGWTLATAIIYSIAMGYLESAVVIYLRAIYYPYGFNFPLAPIDQTIAITELGREAATIIMLLSIAILAGKTVIQKFAYFLLCFAIWDIFYYLFLYLMVSWPESLMTWDILFLLPLPWVGPVIAPVIISLTMILLGLIIIIGEENSKPLRIKAIGWVGLTIGSVVIILSFMDDYYNYLIGKISSTDIMRLLNDQALYEELFSFIPFRFNWLLFIAGEFILLLTIVFISMSRKSKSTSKPI
jgi:hypothetical protein